MLDKMRFRNVAFMQIGTDSKGKKKKGGDCSGERGELQLKDVTSTFYLSYREVLLISVNLLRQDPVLKTKSRQKFAESSEPFPPHTPFCTSYQVLPNGGNTEQRRKQNMKAPP